MRTEKQIKNLLEKDRLEDKVALDSLKNQIMTQMIDFDCDAENPYNQSSLAELVRKNLKQARFLYKRIVMNNSIQNWDVLNPKTRTKKIPTKKKLPTK